VEDYIGCKIKIDHEGRSGKFTQPVLVQSLNDEFEDIPQGSNPLTPARSGNILTTCIESDKLSPMTFYLRTGYGVSQQGYGGTADDPSMGLGQGNGMAPSGFQSVSTLMINTYRRLGHASDFCGAWSGLIFCLAAILYVDDTDLLIVARDRDMTLDEFFEQSQSAVMDWGLIVQATGGYLKDTKCFWYLYDGMAVEEWCSHTAPIAVPS
jgi:hypothetical protein